jgi:hypothetical protein
VTDAHLGSRAALDYISPPISFKRPRDDLEMPLMSPETLEFLLLLSGWIVAFMLGRELQIGFRQWRLRAAEQRTRRQD